MQGGDCKLCPKILIQPPRFAIDTRDNSLSSYFETKRHNITIDTKQNLIYQLGYESLVGSLENQTCESLLCIDKALIFKINLT